MVKIILGEKGKGKTKHLIDLANKKVNDIDGSLVYIDKSTKNMFELSNAIRLIDIKEFPVKTRSSLIGFLSGLISGNRDITDIYIDNVLEITSSKKEEIDNLLLNLNDLSVKHKIDFLLSISATKDEMPDLSDEILMIL